MSRRRIESVNEGEDNINVVVRVRPLNGKEVKNGEASVVQFPGNGQILVLGYLVINGEKFPLLFTQLTYTQCQGCIEQI